MRKAGLFFSITLIILVAACVQLPFGRQQVGPGPGAAAAENPDIALQAVAYPTELRGGRQLTVAFNVTNRHADLELDDVELDVYDSCLFTDTMSWGPETLARNRTKAWTWKWNSSTTQFERDCAVKFKTSWAGTLSLSQDMTVLSESEFYAREQAGTLSELAGTSTATSNPITISLRFSQPLPWLTGDTVYMHIDLADTGGGFIDKLPARAINITFPSNIEADCDGYDEQPVSCSIFTSRERCEATPGCGWTFIPLPPSPPTGAAVAGESCIGTSELNVTSLNRSLSFINRAAPSLTCTLTATADEPISTGMLAIAASYKYELDNSFTVKVKP